MSNSSKQSLYMQWPYYSKKLSERLGKLHYAGMFSLSEARDRGMRLVAGRAGRGAEQVCLYWLVDETDGVIADAKFQAIGPTALIAAADAACELVLRKNHDQASRLSADLIDQMLRDRKDRPAFPDSSAPFLNCVIEAIRSGVEQCFDIPYEEVYDATPIKEDGEEISVSISGWEQMGAEEKRSIIEEILDREIRPYIALDSGGVKVIDIKSGGEVRIAYEGACTACHSSTGSTLFAIQRILRSRIHPTLFVIPEYLDF